MTPCNVREGVIELDLYRLFFTHPYSMIQAKMEHILCNYKIFVHASLHF